MRSCLPVKKEKKIISPRENLAAAVRVRKNNVQLLSYVKSSNKSIERAVKSHVYNCYYHYHNITVVINIIHPRLKREN